MIAALAGLVLYLIVTQLRFDDPHWLFNAWTYVIAVPMIAFALAFVSHGLVSRHVQKSIQIGFLFSIFLHILLLILAINVIIFGHYFPDAFTGVKQERSPIQKTVPEYLFQTPEQTAVTPDWSRPVEAETTSRIRPQEQRQLPPVQHTEPKLEVPKPKQPEQQPIQKYLMQRDQPTESQPQPSDSPAKLARRRTADSQMTAMSRAPRAPDVPAAQSEVSETVLERPVARPRRSEQTTVDLAAATPIEVPLQTQTQRSLAGARSRHTEMPAVGDLGMRRQPRLQRRSIQPAGSSPAPQSVATAAYDQSSHRMLAPSDIQVQRNGQTTGAQMSMGQSASVGPPSEQSNESGAEIARNNLASSRGMPNVTAGQSRRAPGRSRLPTPGFGADPAGAPSANPTVAAAGSTDGEIGDAVGDRLAGDNLAELRSRQNGGSESPNLAAAAASGPALDLLLNDGPAGLAELPGRAGVIPSDQMTIGAIDLTRGTRPRRDVGGPVTPFGTKIAAVESYNRRVLRTRGGAAPTPAGMVGPATEEAIELGLAYLASTQNEDGSWSLQGHGNDVQLQSDCAATGLCLLAFQGAGYTHRQHQYADTVSRGLQFLLENQRTNGDLYRSENTISDGNVALYSHGIAALALCEAYGMTLDDELKQPAQASIDYIANTQNRRRGGWRYAPQVSADTSVTGWMMMALKSGELAGLDVPSETYEGIDKWLDKAQSPNRADRYRYNPFAPNIPSQRHGRTPTPTMTSVGMLMRMYSGWRRDNRSMKSAARYLLKYPPQVGTPQSPQRDTYYWYYATQVMFHMGGDFWEKWNRALTPILIDSQVKEGSYAGSWDPTLPVPDRWSPHAGRLYVTAMNLLNLEVYYRHLPIYEDTAQ